MLSEHLGSICDHMILRSLLTWYSIPVGQGPGVPLLHGRPRLGVKPPVLGTLEEVDLVVTRPHEGGVHLLSSVDSAPKSSIRRFVITEKAPTMAFS